MSHQVTVSLKIKDIGALETAAREIGCSVEVNADCRVWGKTEKRPLVLRVPGAKFDVSVSQQIDKPDAGAVLSTDWYGGTVEKIVGKDYGRLMQHYGACVAEKSLRARGYMPRRTVRADGAFVITGVSL